MSKELLDLEKKSSQKIIRDKEHIDRVLKHLLHMPFSCLKKDATRYRFIISSLAEGFELDRKACGDLSIRDLLLLLAHEPDREYFKPTDQGNIKMNAHFNSAADCFCLAVALNSQKTRYIRISEFMNIQVDALVCYANQRFIDQHKKQLISPQAYEERREAVNRFTKMFEPPDIGYSIPRQLILSDTSTIGDVISGAMALATKTWPCTAIPLSVHANQVVRGYDILNRLFMDVIEPPFAVNNRRYMDILREFAGEPLYYEEGDVDASL